MFYPECGIEKQHHEQELSCNNEQTSLTLRVGDSVGTWGFHVSENTVTVSVSGPGGEQETSAR